jgi:tRNA(adenine34) deaminase
MRMEIHETYMQRCLALGREALEAGETPVGALIVHGDAIVGRGREESRALRDPTAHAEVQAIRAACQNKELKDLSECTLYTTVEPCLLCGYVIRRVGLRRVVYGAPAGQAGGASSRYAILLDSGISGWPAPPEIVAGVLAEECLALLREPRKA